MLKKAALNATDNNTEESSNIRQLIGFLDRESSEDYKQLFWMAAISGVANGLLLAIVNHAAHIISHDEDPTQYFVLYMIAFILFLYTQWYAFDRSIILIQGAIYNIRTRLSQKIQRVELSFIEKVGSDHLYSRLTQNDTFISQAIPQITATAQMSILMIFSFLYLAYISPITFFISMVTVVAGGLMFHLQSKVIRKALNNAQKKESIYFRAIADMVNGFKEIKINKSKSDDILKNITKISSESQKLRIDAGRREARMWGFGRVFIYALLPILVFIIPMVYEEHASDIYKITATLLFITGPITILVNMIPVVGRVSMAIDAIQILEKEMDDAGAASISHQNAVSDNRYKAFKQITIDDLEFTYPGSQNAFSAGPFNQSLYRGELLFIIGGNGSGKSTFLKLLTGLYQANTGNIRIDSETLDTDNIHNYRELYSIVFTDFHLFEKIYGIENLDASKVNFWLEKMHMQHKVQFKDGGFTSTQLSTGQRKRLAFIAAILEEKPILVIDEFAADQDPQFRQYFYETLLIELKAAGKTIIAVTHDDHYFHVADRVLKMEEGKMVLYDDSITH